MNHILKSLLTFKSILILVVTLQLLLLIKSDWFYTFSDAYVYQSYAKSLLDFGVIRDLTTSPFSQPVTGQLGVLYLIYFPLYFLGADTQNSIYIAQFLFIVIYLISAGQLFSIAKKITSNDSAKKILLLFLTATPSYFYYASPINDGIYLVCVFSLINVVISESKFKSNALLKSFGYLVVGSLCRNQMILIGIAIAIYFLFQKRYRESFLYGIISILAILLGLIVIRLSIQDFSGMEGTLSQILTNLATLKGLSSIFSQYTSSVIGPLFFSFGSLRDSNNIYLLFIQALLTLFFVYILVRGLIHGGWSRLVSLIALSAHLFLFVSPVLIDRYVYFTIFIFYMVGYVVHKKLFSGLIVFMVALNISILTYRILVVPPLAKIMPESQGLLACLKGTSFKVYSVNPRLSYFDLNGISSIEYQEDIFLDDFNKSPNQVFLIFKTSSGEVFEDIGNPHRSKYRSLRLIRREPHGLISYYYYLYSGENAALSMCLESKN